MKRNSLGRMSYIVLSLIILGGCASAFKNPPSTERSAELDRRQVYKENESMTASSSGARELDVGAKVQHSFDARLVSHVYAKSGKTYEIVPHSLRNGSSVYIDRSFTYKSIPKWLNGATYIKTANSDKASKGEAFMSIDIHEDVTIYVLYDDRIAKKPSWLSSFVDTGYNLKTDVTFSIFVRDASAGTISFGGNEGGGASMYTVVIDNRKLFKIIAPSNLDLKTSRDVLIKCLALGFPPGWRTEFIMNRDFANPMEGSDCDHASQALICLRLLDLFPAEYSIYAYMVNERGVPQPFSDEVNFGVGDYYVALGDSITRGSHDNYRNDNTSSDGRNRGGGYPPILNDLLTQRKGYPHTVVNEGLSGRTSLYGQRRIGRLLRKHGEAQFFLILFGTNDAHPSKSLPSGMGLNSDDSSYPGSFKDNMERIIKAILEEKKTPVLAKVPFLWTNCDQCLQLIEEYNIVIDELREENDIQIEAPDFFNHFRALPQQLEDYIHPNGIGYQSMAELWSGVLP